MHDFCPADAQIMQDNVWKLDPEWFRPWFNTEAYHILYGHRSEREAQHLVSQLCASGWLGKEGKLLDAGCGSGRHSRSFAELGWDVIGIDLSEKSIQTARSIRSDESLDLAKFEVEDLRNVHVRKEWEGSFDVVANFFTSVGYFETEEEHRSVFRGFAHALKPGGRLFIDFLNAPQVIANLSENETIEKEGMSFIIHRRFHQGWIEKSIQFELDGERHHHVERVRALTLNDFSVALEDVGLEILNLFGDNNLGPWHEASPRMMILAQKPNLVKP